MLPRKVIRIGCSSTFALWHMQVLMCNRGEDDDFVKLYDLTSLCGDLLHTDVDANPFTLPVAVLMYRVARNVLRVALRGGGNSEVRVMAIHAQCHAAVQTSTGLRRVANSVYRLLNNCLELLTAQKYPQA